MYGPLRTPTYHAVTGSPHQHTAPIKYHRTGLRKKIAKMVANFWKQINPVDSIDYLSVEITLVKTQWYIAKILNISFQLREVTYSGFGHI